MKQAPPKEWDWITAGLLFLLLQVAAARLVTTDWAPYLYWTETLAGFGTFLGLGLGISQFRRAAVFLLATCYTAAVLPWQLTRSAKDDYIVDRLNRVGATLASSFNQFFNKQPVKDPLFFLLFVCLAFWLMGLIAGYGLARQGRVLPSIIIAGAALVITQAYGNYQPRGSWWLAVYVLLALLLVSRVHFLQHRKRWAQGRVFVSEDAGTNILAGLFMTAALAVFAAWWLPGSIGNVQRAADTWNTYIEPIRERLSNAVTSLSGPYGKPGENFYGSSLPLGQNAASGDTVLLSVEILESPGLNVRYYWRGRAYNDYAAGSWSASTNSQMLYHPQQADLGIPDSADRSEGIFAITSQFPTQRLIYAPSPTVWLDRAADLAAMRMAPNEYDVFSWQARTPVPGGSVYQIRASLRNPTVVQLREAADSYPDSIVAKYLSIPEAYRDRLGTLTGDVTSGSDTPYDKAVAVTNYLRRTIEYSTSVPAPPEGEDPVMWVLFDHKQGFCNYYASAEVLMLRSIGIPARLAVGFARGELEGSVYTVHRRDAHAWPEVYFPGIGWVEFEPTSNQAPLTRPSGVQANGNATTEAQRLAETEQDANREPELVELAPPAAPLPFRLTPFGRALFTALPIMFVLVALILVYRVRAWRRLPALVSRAIEAGGGPVPAWVRDWENWQQREPVERAFAAVTWSLRFLGRPQPVDATPAAQTTALSRLMPSSARQIEVLGAELEAGLFTARPANLRRARAASLMVLFYAVRARLGRIIAAMDGRAVYSDPEM